MYHRGATAFVLSSRDDAMPNALLEAAAAGLPIITSPSSRGLVDLLHDKPGVWIASSVSAQSLEDALADALSKLTPSQRIAHRWVDRFDIQTAIRGYESVLDQSLREREE
jgi:glycosyltransferase involved in cell wall biosynthesis